MISNLISADLEGLSGREFLAELKVKITEFRLDLASRKNYQALIYDQIICFVSGK
jgi:hypothetical protein